jgi:cellulose synthase (UDP-forming)
VIPAFWVAVTCGFVLAGIRRIRDPRFSAERREAHRFPVRMPATLDGVPAQLVDVSLGGGQLRVWGLRAPVGSDVELAVTVPDRVEPVVFRATVLSHHRLASRVQFVGRQWQSLAALSATAFGAGAARWAEPAAREQERAVHLAGAGTGQVPLPLPVPGVGPQGGPRSDALVDR